MSRRVVGPFNRVEGDLEVQLEINNGLVTDSWVVSPMFRGFEQMLHGKHPLDAMTYVPRICGICSVAQSVAAAYALANAQGIKMPANGENAVNLILANENLSDHLTHFYLFFMPDFARKIYSNEPWYREIADRFEAMKGPASKEMLSARAQFMHLMGLLAGKWPHSLAIQPGGTSRIVKSEEKVRILAILHQFRGFLETTLFGDSLESIVAMTSADELNQWQEKHACKKSDFSRFLTVSKALKLDTLGRATDRFMSYGVYPRNGSSLFAQGVWYQGKVSALNTDKITEDVSHSWMLKSQPPKHPFNGVTQPDPEMKDGYTWCKAPRLDSEVVEVGALARQVVNGHPLMCDLVKQSGGNVQNRVIARLLELAIVVIEMEVWAKEIRPEESFCVVTSIPDEAEGVGLMEAARGSLGHWLRIKNGRILNYQIIAPTTWNFSPRDENDILGPLEQALIDTVVRNGETTPVAVQHIVRSFDPCMVCTVH